MSEPNLHLVRSGTAKRPSRGDTAHSVQFYENSNYLAAAVSEFIADGLTNGQSVILIATDEHRQAFERCLRSKSFSLDHAERRGLFRVLDAHRTLNAFMVDDVPDRERFRTTMVPVIEESRTADRLAGLRLYGEMVDVLWKAGNTSGAIRLESLWNELGDEYAFNLLCAYSMGNFYRSSDADAFHEICLQHSHVIPTETFTEASQHERAIEISRLQQRALALENEIAHRVEIEHRLREALDVAHRAEEALRASRDEAQRANRAKTEFLSAMSHELRTPLNSIGGFIELIETGIHGPVNDAQLAALQRVSRSQRHLLTLINDLLNLARIESGQMEYELEDISVRNLLAEVCDVIGPLLDKKQLSGVVKPVPDDARLIRADAEKARQILLNLLSNAVKFTPPGGQITLSANRCPDEAHLVCMHVQDTGVGIPEPKLATIFEPFVRLAPQNSTATEGIGLGLAISRDLARGMAGDLRVTSQLDQGTTFTLRLPRSTSGR